MSSLEQLALAAWKQDSNNLFVAFRAYKSGSTTSQTFNCVKGTAYNVIQAVGHAFASIPVSIRERRSPSTQHNIHRMESAIYAEMSWICFKAIFNFKLNMDQLLEMETRLCLTNLFLEKQTIATPGTIILLNAPDTKYSAEDLFQNFTQLIKQLPAQRQLSVLIYLEKKISVMPPGDLQMRIIEFLYTFPSGQREVSEKAQSLLRGILKSSYQSTGGVLIAYSDNTLQFVHKETVEIGAPLLFAVEQFAPALAGGIKEGFPDGVRFSENGKQNRALLEKLNALYVSPNDVFFEDLDFLIQILPGKTTEKICTFLNLACTHWERKILAGSEIRDKQLASILTIRNELDHIPLLQALTLYFLARFKLSALPHDWRETIKLSKKTLIDLMFAQENKISPTPIFMQMLTFFLQEHLWSEDILQLCNNAQNHSAQLRPLTPKRLAALQTVFAEAWKAFQPSEHMDVCLALYKSNFKDTQGALLLPMLAQTIPAAALELAKQEAQPPQECDEILALALLNTPASQTDFKKNCFERLHLAGKKQMDLLKNACVQRILEHEFHLDKDVHSNQSQLLSFVDALQHYTGLAQDRHHAEVLKEGVAIHRFANGLPKKHANLQKTCLSYLQSKSGYLDAATKATSAEAKALSSVFTKSK